MQEELPLPEMCPTTTGTTTGNTANADGAQTDGAQNQPYDWRKYAVEGGSLRHVDLQTGSNGWASPPANVFTVRGPGFFSDRQKIPAEECLLKPAGVDWLCSLSRLNHVLGRPDNRIAAALRRAHDLGCAQKAFLFAVNLQIPGVRDCRSSVFYFVSEDPIPPGTLLYRFVHGDDAFRDARFKIVNRIVKGPWIVKSTVGNYSACLLGKALTCTYHRGENYLEIDVDIESSAIAKAILRLALGCVTAITVDMAFLVESQEEDELPERLLGTVRVAQMEMGSATYVDTKPEVTKSPSFRGKAKVTHHENGTD